MTPRQSKRGQNRAKKRQRRRANLLKRSAPEIESFYVWPRGSGTGPPGPKT